MELGYRETGVRKLEMRDCTLEMASETDEPGGGTMRNTWARLGCTDEGRRVNTWARLGCTDVGRRVNTWGFESDGWTA